MLVCEINIIIIFIACRKLGLVEPVQKKLSCFRLSGIYSEYLQSKVLKIDISCSAQL